MEAILPLFPLHIVVYPNSFYPLHIFEERYKKLVLHALKYNTSFGISPMLNNQITPIGTVVKVQEITRQHDDSSFDVIVKGFERFTISRWWMHDIGYAEAVIKQFSDVSSTSSLEMQSALEYRFKETLDVFKISLDNRFWQILERTQLKSFKIAEKSGLILEQQIKLLEMRNEDERISLLLQHFSQLIKYHDDKATIEKIVLNDGYLNLQ